MTQKAACRVKELDTVIELITHHDIGVRGAAESSWEMKRAVSIAGRRETKGEEWLVLFIAYAHFVLSSVA